MNSFFINNNNFHSNSWEHIVSVLIFTLIGIGFILYGKRVKDEKKKLRLLLVFTFSIFLAQLAKVAILLSMGLFNVKTDLPFHLCNIAPFILWLSFYLNNKKIWGVIFMWIMAGTLQANFTTTLTQSFPHFEWFRYWIIHVWLIIAIIYAINNLGYRIKRNDIFRSIFWLNIFALVLYPVNKLLSANYLFLVAKPDEKTMYSLLGDWPYYIFQLEFVALLLFSLLYLPFYLHARKAKEK